MSSPKLAVLHFSPQWKNYSWIIISVIKLQFHGEPEYANERIIVKELPWTSWGLSFLSLLVYLPVLRFFGDILSLFTGRLKHFQESITGKKGPTLLVPVHSSTVILLR